MRADYKNDLDQKFLKERLEYDPDTGDFLWKKSYGSRAKPGSVAGYKNRLNGYINITIDSTIYLAHRLAFLYMTGSFPQNDVDHINGIRDDNRWENLRDVSFHVNHKNRRKSSRNTSGFTGVWFDKNTGRWAAQIKHNYKTIHLGQFEDIEDAKKSRLAANERYAFHENHGADAQKEG